MEAYYEDGGGSGGGYYVEPAPNGGGGAGDYGSGYTALDGGGGGLVGGLSALGANLSTWAGAGSGGYNMFTPSLTYGFTIPSKPYKGMDTAGNAGRKLLGIMQSFLGQLQSGTITATEALTGASTLQGYLNNPNVFYQARSGRDNRLMNDFRTQAANITNSIANWLPAVTTNTPDPTSPDPVPDDPSGEQQQSLIQQLSSLLTPRGATNFEAPPNLFSMTPTGDSSTGGSGMNMQKMLIIGAVVVAAYFLYKKYA